MVFANWNNVVIKLGPMTTSSQLIAPKVIEIIRMDATKNPNNEWTNRFKWHCWNSAWKSNTSLRCNVLNTNFIFIVCYSVRIIYTNFLTVRWTRWYKLFFLLLCFHWRLVIFIPVCSVLVNSWLINTRYNRLNENVVSYLKWHKLFWCDILCSFLGIFLPSLDGVWWRCWRQRQ